MRILMLMLISCAAVATVTAGPCSPGSGVWNEGDGGQGDAGKKPATANVTGGSGALTRVGSRPSIRPGRETPLPQG